MIVTALRRLAVSTNKVSKKCAAKTQTLEGVHTSQPSMWEASNTSMSDVYGLTLNKYVPLRVFLRNSTYTNHTQPSKHANVRNFQCGAISRIWRRILYINAWMTRASQVICDALAPSKATRKWHILICCSIKSQLYSTGREEVHRSYLDYQPAVSVQMRVVQSRRLSAQPGVCDGRGFEGVDLRTGPSK